MRQVLSGLGCFLLSVLLLPLLLILIGPLLTLAALRGRQPAGPLTLDTSRYGLLGRLGIALLGLALWLLIWSGLAWVMINGLLTAPLAVETPPTPPVVAVQPVVSQPQSTPTPTSPATPTPLPSTSTPTPLPTMSTPTPVTPSATPTAMLIPTTTPAVDTPAPASQSTPASPPGQLKDSLTLTSTLTLTDQTAIEATVEEGNRLLREAISLANDANLQKLGEVWQDPALTKAQNFAAGLYQRYAKPFDVQFDYTTPPTIRLGQLGQAIVVQQETWVYQGRRETNRESFEFTYVLYRLDERWVITQYGYRNLPVPTPTATGSE